MNESTIGAQLRDEYLLKLEDALREIPHGLALEIRSGISEELMALSAPEISTRITELGDPTAIARSALLESSPAAPIELVVTSATTTPGVTSSKGFAIVSAIVLGFGGLILPAVGWLIGVGMVATSRFWRTWEKTLAILFPVAITAVILLAYFVFSLAQGSSDSELASFAHASGGFSPPRESDFTANPLLPAAYDAVWSTTILVALVAVPISAAWLLFRLRGRTAPVK